MELPNVKKDLKNYWLFRIKKDDNFSCPQHKARQVVKEFTQRIDIDFDEIFSHIVKMSSIHVVLGLAAGLDFKVEQMDVKTTFHHDDVEAKNYTKQPEGFMVKDKDDYIYKLNLSLYNLKNASRQW